jgi:hypothetical protein
MTGYPQWNFAAFDAAAADLRQRGYEVVNPVDLDRDVGFDPATSSPEDFDLVSAIRRDVEALVTCQLIAMLPGHENSKGATAERHIAYWAGLDVVEYPSMAPIGTELPVDPWDVRNRSTPEQDEAYLARVTDEFVEDGKVFADEIRAAIKREFANSFTRWTKHQVQEPKQDPSQDSSSGHRPIPEGMRRELLECFGVEGTGTIPQAVKNVAYVPADFADDEGVKEWLGRNDVKPEDIRVVHNRESLGDKIVEFGKILKDHQTIVQPIDANQVRDDAKKTVETDEEDILSIAYRITLGDRQNSYGPPDQDFRRTANMWTGLFGEMLKPGVKFEPFHVAQAMILIKLSRQLHQRKADNWVDIAGYARCGAICDEAAKNAS